MEQLTKNCNAGDIDACAIISQSNMFQIAFVIACSGAALWFIAHMVERFHKPKYR